EMYGDDPQVRAELASHTDDPDILAAGSDALEWNRQGILAYQQKDYTRARELLRRATASQPRNISFALNTAQSLLRLMRTEPSAALREARQARLQRARRLPDGAHRRQRFLTPSERREGLQQAPRPIAALMIHQLRRF